jgi:hypothetical protein
MLLLLYAEALVTYLFLPTFSFFLSHLLCTSSTTPPSSLPPSTLLFYSSLYPLYPLYLPFLIFVFFSIPEQIEGEKG